MQTSKSNASVSSVILQDRIQDRPRYEEGDDGSESSTERKLRQLEAIYDNFMERKSKKPKSAI